MRACTLCQTEVSTSWIIDGKPYCGDCKHTPKNTRRVVNEDEIWNGTYEHIAWNPIQITGGRKELIEVCKKHGCAPKALLKPRSQGKGYEMQQRSY